MTARRSKHIVILFLMGSEVRQFGHSGLVASLLDSGWKVTIAAKTVDDDFRAQIDSRANVVMLLPLHLPFLLGQIYTILDKANALRQELKGTKGWRYHKPIAAKNWKQRLLFAFQDIAASLGGHIPLLYKLGQVVERWMQSRIHSSEWSAFWKEQMPQVVLVNIPRTGGLSIVLDEARRSGAKTVLFYHTWKDVTVATARHNHTFDVIGVWNQTMAAQLLEQNPQIDPHRISIIGCGHFDCVGRTDWIIPEVEFRQNLGLRPNSRILLFTASAPWVVPEEEKYMALLVSALESGRLPDDVEIVVRTNPMDTVGVLYNHVKALFPNICVVESSWRWDQKQNWCFQRKSDTFLYNSLLMYASLNVSVPSTVTIECAIANLPVVNIGFTPAGISEPMTSSILDFWDTSFYSGVRDTGAATFARDLQDLIRLIRYELVKRDRRSENRRDLVHAQLGVPPHETVIVSTKLINRLI